MGIFDLFGVFFFLKKVQKEFILEEQEMDFWFVDEGEECFDFEGSYNEEVKEFDKINKKEGEKIDRIGVEVSEEIFQILLLFVRLGIFLDYQFQEVLQFERKDELKIE